MVATVMATRPGMILQWSDKASHYIDAFSPMQPVTGLILAMKDEAMMANPESGERIYI